MSLSENENHKASKIQQDDNESLLEKCWNEEYKGDSRKWLIRDASAKTPRGLLCSAMKESYIYPEKAENTDERNMGKRKTYLLKKFYQEAFDEITEENEQKQEPLDYCTEYDNRFKIKDFKPDDAFYTRNTERFQKYPLYSSAPISYYSMNHANNPEGIIKGLTKISDKMNIFKKNSQFSKPIDESLDYAEL